MSQVVGPDRLWTIGYKLAGDAQPWRITARGQSVFALLQLAFVSLMLVPVLQQRSAAGFFPENAAQPRNCFAVILGAPFPSHADRVLADSVFVNVDFL